MSWQGPEFVIAIILISTIGWIASTWIRAKHGYPVENEWTGMSEPSDVTSERKIALLTTENGRLQDKIGRLEERLATVERIVTDPGHRLGHEIEKLR